MAAVTPAAASSSTHHRCQIGGSTSNGSIAAVALTVPSGATARACSV